MHTQTSIFYVFHILFVTRYRFHIAYFTFCILRTFPNVRKIWRMRFSAEQTETYSRCILETYIYLAIRKLSEKAYMTYFDY